MQNLLISIYNVMTDVSFRKSFLFKQKPKNFYVMDKTTAACKIRSALPNCFALISLTAAQKHVQSTAWLTAIPQADHSYSMIFTWLVSKEAALPATITLKGANMQKAVCHFTVAQQIWRRRLRRSHRSSGICLLSLLHDTPNLPPSNP